MLATKNQNLLVFLICAVMFIVAFTFYASQPLLSDVSYFVAADQRILKGAVPYIDIFENNPPLAFWVTMPAVWVASVLGLPAEPTFVVFILVLNALILTLIWSLHSAAPLGNRYRQQLVLILAVVTSFCLAFGFGQREYFMTLLLLPYISVIALRERGQSVTAPHQILVGVLAGIGVCFKPYFIFIPFCLEIYLVLQTRQWRFLFRSEVLIAAAIILLYPVLVWLFYPAYISDIIPLTLLTYGAFRASLAEILMTSTFVLFLVPTVATAMLFVLTPSRDRSILVWVLAALAGLAIHFVQHMGWPYHLLPGLAFITIALLLSALHLKQPVLQMLICIPMLACIGLGLMDYRQIQHTSLTRFDDLMKDVHPQRMIILTYDLGDTFPFVPAHGIEWVGHYQSLWPLVAVVKNTISPAESHAVIASVAQTLALDLNEQKPDHVIVDHRLISDHPEAGNYSPVERLSVLASFSSAWSHYKMVNENAGFQLWQRQ